MIQQVLGMKSTAILQRHFVSETFQHNYCSGLGELSFKQDEISNAEKAKKMADVYLGSIRDNSRDIFFSLTPFEVK
jgi:hypothetical protein